MPKAATRTEEKPYVYHMLPASQHAGGQVLKATAGPGSTTIYTIDLGGEPAPVYSYLHLHPDTAQAVQSLNLTVNYSQGTLVEARIRQYVAAGQPAYSTPQNWQVVPNGQPYTIGFSTDHAAIAAGGPTLLEYRTTKLGGGSFTALTEVSYRATLHTISEYQPRDVLVTICDEKDNYRFGYQKQEKDNEIAGIGNHYDFKFRGYDTRTGRLWSVDPMARSYPWNSAYAFAENDVIRCIDLEGLEKVDVVTTSFAPFDLFGSDGFGAFTGDGAARKFGLEVNKYRTSGSVKLDLANSKHVSSWSATNVTSTYHRYSNWLFKDYTAKSPSTTKVNRLNLQSNFVGTNFSVTGSNKAHMSAPTIDVNVAIGFQRINDNKYTVSGTVSGDRFPANETYLRDEAGNMLMIGVSGVNTENENLGPYKDLPGDNRRFMSSFNFNVIFEGENNSIIKGVETHDGKFIDRETWNQQFQQLDPKSSQTGTSSY